jgi:ribosomal-protein-alanine N-acetyltransferase
VTWSPVTLSTPRLLLRPLSPADAPAMQAYSQDPELSAQMTWEPHRSLADSQRFIEQVVLPGYARGVPRALGLSLREDPAGLIGSIGADWLPDRPGSLNLGYVLAKAQWGKGLMTEAGRAFIAHCFEALPAERLEAICTEGNTRSAAALLRMGLAYEGLKPEPASIKGTEHRMQVYALTRDAWRQGAA